MLRKFFATGAMFLIISALSACNGSNTNLLPTVAPSASTATPAISIMPQITAQPTTAAAVPTPGPTPDMAKVINSQPDDWTRGAVSPTVTIIEWSDFQCPYSVSYTHLRAHETRHDLV